MPWLEWPLRHNELPATPVILDLLEFCAMAVGEMHKRSWHDFMDHYHVSWDHEAGLSAFVLEVNRLLARNGFAFEMSPQGKIRRILPDALAPAIAQARLSTGDDETDRLLEAARIKILAPKHDDRSDGLESVCPANHAIPRHEMGESLRFFRLGLARLTSADFSVDCVVKAPVRL